MINDTKLKTEVPKYIRVTTFKMNTKQHRKILNEIESVNKFIAQFLRRCDIEIYDPNIFILRFSKSSIYSENAIKYIKKIKNVFTILFPEVENIKILVFTMSNKKKGA